MSEKIKIKDLKLEEVSRKFMLNSLRFAGKAAFFPQLKVK